MSLVSTFYDPGVPGTRSSTRWSINITVVWLESEKVETAPTFLQ